MLFPVAASIYNRHCQWRMLTTADVLVYARGSLAAGALATSRAYANYCRGNSLCKRLRLPLEQSPPTPSAGAFLFASLRLPLPQAPSKLRLTAYKWPLPPELMLHTAGVTTKLLWWDIFVFECPSHFVSPVFASNFKPSKNCSKHTLIFLRNMSCNYSNMCILNLKIKRETVIIEEFQFKLQL